MAKDFKNALKKYQAQEETKEKAHITYNGASHIELIDNKYYLVFEDTEELRDLQDKDIIIDTPEYTQEELKKMYEAQNGATNINDTLEVLDNILYKNLGELLAYYTNEKEQTAASYTLKTTKPLLDLLRGLACVEKLSIKELIVKALCDYIKNAPEKDLERAKEYKKKYLD